MQPMHPPTHVAPLVHIDADGNVSPNTETMQWLRSLEKPFAVVSIAGKYRTGKSLLMNRLAECQPNCGFGVGETVQACTKGLWIRKELVAIAPGKWAIFMDTEGIDALDTSNDGDIRIFTLALLLSSVFMYNSTGHIDEAAMSTLTLMTRVAERLIHTLPDNGELSEHMPTFLWVLRDFSLRLEDKAGGALTDAEYLEMALRDCSGQSTRKNATRQLLRRTFVDRHLITLPRPARDETVATGLNDKPWQMSAKFHEAVEGLKATLATLAEPIQSRRTPLSGSMFAALCETLCVHSTSDLPAMQDGWTLMSDIHAKELHQAIRRDAVTACSEWGPGTAATLRECLEALVTTGMAEYDRRRMPEAHHDIRSALEEDLRGVLEDHLNRNVQTPDDLAHAIMDSLDAMRQCEPDTLVARVQKAHLDAVAQHGTETANAVASSVLPCLLSTWMPSAIARMRIKCIEEKQAGDDALSDASHQHAMACDSMRQQVGQLKARIVEVESEMAVLVQTVDRERLDNDDLRAKVTAANVSITALQTELMTSPVSAEGVASIDGPSQLDFDTMADRLQSALDTLGLREIELLQETTRADELSNRLTEAADKVRSLEDKEKTLSESWRQGLTRVTRETNDALAQRDRRLQESRAEVSRLTGVVEESQRDAAASERALERVRDEREREVRQAVEQAEKYRSASEAGQERVVTMHRSVLEDLKVRDERLRAMQQSFLAEQTTLQEKHMYALRDVDAKASQINALKRRVEDAEGTESEVKRIRFDVQEQQMAMARRDAENHILSQRLDALTCERDTCVKQMREMEGELGILRAEKALMDAQKSFH